MNKRWTRARADACDLYEHFCMHEAWRKEYDKPTRHDIQVAIEKAEKILEQLKKAYEEASL